jgi:PIN domain nuclease of toxin-antitoxin system
LNLLLDTVTFLWMFEDSINLSAAARRAIQDLDNTLFLSAVSVWEISIKYRLGKLPLPQMPEQIIPRQRALRGIASLDLTEAAALRLSQLPGRHKDPFDRILACQAIEHSMTIVTPDVRLRAYPVHSLW